MRNWRFVWPIVLRWPLRRKRWDILLDGKGYTLKAGVRSAESLPFPGKITVGDYVDTSKVPPLYSDRRPYQARLGYSDWVGGIAQSRVNEDPIECD